MYAFRLSTLCDFAPHIFSKTIFCFSCVPFVRFRFYFFGLAVGFQCTYVHIVSPTNVSYLHKCIETLWHRYCCLWPADIFNMTQDFLLALLLARFTFLSLALFWRFVGRSFWVHNNFRPIEIGRNRNV